MTDPVLFGNKPNAGNNTRDTTAEGQNGADDDKNIYDFQGILDDDSIIFIDSLGGEDESGVGDCWVTSVDSNGSSMASGCGAATRRGMTRPVSYVLTSRNGDPSGIPRSSRPNGESHGCQICRGGACCWCPDGHVMRGTPPGDNRQPRQRGNRSTGQDLSSCSTCGKMYLPANTSCQWCFMAGCRNHQNTRCRTDE